MATAKKTASTQKSAPAKEATEAVEAAVATGQENIEAATKQVEKVVEMTKAQVEKTSSAAFKGYDEFTALGKENMDAFVKSSTIAAKGFETVGKEWVSFTQSMMEAREGRDGHAERASPHVFRQHDGRDHEAGRHVHEG